MNLQEYKKYLEEQKQQVMDWARTYIAKEAERLREHIYHQAMNQIQTERLLLQEESRLATWKNIYQELQKVEVK